MAECDSGLSGVTAGPFSEWRDFKIVDFCSLTEMVRFMKMSEFAIEYSFNGTYHIPLGRPTVVMHFDVLGVDNLADLSETPSVHCVLCIYKPALIITIVIVVLLQDLELLV